jgi:hypothetical protein
MQGLKDNNYDFDV